MNKGLITFVMSLLLVAAIAFFQAVFMHDVSDIITGSVVIVLLVGILYHG